HPEENHRARLAGAAATLRRGSLRALRRAPARRPPWPRTAGPPHVLPRHARAPLERHHPLLLNPLGSGSGLGPGSGLGSDPGKEPDPEPGSDPGWRARVARRARIIMAAMATARPAA